VAGFTLIEVMVAMTVSAIVLLGARLLLGELADDAARIAAEARSGSEEINGERVLRATIMQMEVGTWPGTTFGGDKNSAAFHSWCDVPRGWRERCRVELAVRAVADSAQLIMVTSVGARLTVLRRQSPMTLRYLSSAASGGTWIRTWGTGITAPVAIGVFTVRDTLIVRIGERG
jgi:prepilin-type N-terminal cleavage/methylation domain-containing protein